MVSGGWRAWSRKAWHFLWHEESIASWLVNLALAFVLIKYLLYPGLGLLLGTPFPVVAVVSSSMEHDPRNFEAWWQENEDFYLSQNITQFEFLRYPFRNGFNKGDIMVLTGADPETARKGTVLVYWSGKPYPIIHRFIGQNGQFLMTKGDNNDRLVQEPDPLNPGRYLLNEYEVHPDSVLGKASLRIPFLGWVKILAVNLYQCTLYAGRYQHPYLACLIDGIQPPGP